MEAVLERRRGLDVRKKSVAACVITPQGRISRTFRSMTKELLELADWLRVKEVSHVRSAT
jgi:hypothetical protein